MTFRRFLPLLFAPSSPPAEWWWGSLGASEDLRLPGLWWLWEVVDLSGEEGLAGSPWKPGLRFAEEGGGGGGGGEPFMV